MPGDEMNTSLDGVRYQVESKTEAVLITDGKKTENVHLHLATPQDYNSAFQTLS